MNLAQIWKSTFSRRVNRSWKNATLSIIPTISFSAHLSEVTAEVDPTHQGVQDIAEECTIPGSIKTKVIFSLLRPLHNSKVSNNTLDTYLLAIINRAAVFIKIPRQDNKSKRRGPPISRKHLLFIRKTSRNNVQSRETNTTATPLTRTLTISREITFHTIKTNKLLTKTPTRTFRGPTSLLWTPSSKPCLSRLCPNSPWPSNPWSNSRT